MRVARNPVTGQTGPAVLIGGLVPGTGDITNGMVLNNDASYPNGFIENPSVLYEHRVGISYDVSGDGKTALRASVGVFHSTRSSANASWNTSRQPPVQFSPSIFYSTMDNLLQSTGVNFPTNTQGFTRDSKTPVVYSFSASVQRAIGWNTVLDVAYVGSRARNLIQARNINTIPFGARFNTANEDPTRPGNPLPDNFLRPYRGWGSLNVFEHTGISDYNALQVQANRRYSNRFQFGAAYTLSRSRDFTSGDGGGALPIYQDVRDWTYGLSSFDATHVLVFNYTWDLPKMSALVDRPGDARQLAALWHQQLLQRQSGGRQLHDRGQHRHPLGRRFAQRWERQSDCHHGRSEAAERRANARTLVRYERLRAPDKRANR